MIDGSNIFTVCRVDLMHDVWKQEIRLLFWYYQKFKFRIWRVLTFSKSPPARMFAHTFWALTSKSARPVLWTVWEKCLKVLTMTNYDLSIAGKSIWWHPVFFPEFFMSYLYHVRTKSLPYGQLKQSPSSRVVWRIYQFVIYLPEPQI